MNKLHICRDDEDVEIMEDDESVPKQTKMKAKFLRFRENYRPPYYGTWRKKSKFVKPRTPFGKDEVMCLDHTFFSKKRQGKHKIVREMF